MVMNYADVTDVLGTANEELFADIDDRTISHLITHASRLIRHATRAAIYDVDPAGNPADPVEIDAFREAVCHQVEAWAIAGVTQEILTGGASSQPKVKATSDNGASITFDTSTGDAGVAFLLSGGLAPLAAAALEDAGLIGALPGVVY